MGDLQVTPAATMATFGLLHVNGRYGMTLMSCPPSPGSTLPDHVRKSALVCFGVRGLDRLRGVLDPDVLRIFQDSVTAEMTRRAQESGGTLEAAGDGALCAVFGARGTAVRYPEQAVECALGVLAEFQSLMPEIRGLGMEISCSAGIAWGTPDIFTRESAVALESAASDNSLLVSPEIAVMTGDRWTWRPAGADGLRAMAPVEERPHFRPPSPAPDHPVRKQLADAWQRFLEEGEGASGGVAIVGDPGLGKNELAQDFASHISLDGETVALCCGTGRDWQPPMGMWFVIGGELARTGDEHLPLWLEGALSTLAGGRKRAVVFVREVHNADEASLKTLSRLLVMPPENLSMFFILVGDHLPDQLPAHRLTVVRPVPLQRTEIAGFIQQALEGGKEPGLVDLLASYLTNSAMGYPLFVHHALLHLISEGYLQRDGSGTWRLPGKLPGISPTVEAALKARIAALPPELRTGLSLAALLGRCFGRDLFLHVHTALTGTDGAPVLEALAQTGLLAELGSSFHFTEGIMADTAAALPAPEHARLIHRAAAGFLSRGEDPSPADPLALETANHFHGAGLHSQAFPWALTALEQMVAARDCSGGLRLLERMASWPSPDDDARYRMDLAAFELKASKGCHREALELFDKVMPGASAPVLARIRLIKANVLADMGETLSSVAILDSMLQEAEEGSEIRATVLCRLSKLFAQLGNAVRSREHQDAALAMVDRNPDLMECILGNLAMTRLLAGDTVKAEELCRRALEIPRYGGNLNHRATLFGALSIIAMRTNRLEQGLELSAAAVEIHRRSGNDKGLCAVLGNTGGMLARAGRLEPALEAITEALEMARRIQSADLICSTAHNLGNLLSILGRYQEAEACFTESLARAESMGNSRYMALALTGLGAVKMKSGSLDQAERFLERAERMHDRAGNIGGRATCLSDLAETYLKRGEAERAVPPVLEAIKLAEASGDFQSRISTRLLHARIMLAMGKVEDATRIYHEACAEEAVHGITVCGFEAKGVLEREFAEMGVQISSTPDR